MLRSAAPPLTKSSYLTGLECPRKLWLEQHEPTAPDEGARYRMRQGREVGRHARERFKEGHHVRASGQEKALRETQAALASGADVLFEAAFRHAGVFARVDILQKRSGSAWDLIEVKASSRVKKKHRPDVALQASTVRGSGLDVGRCFVMYLNKEHKHPDPDALFQITEVTGDLGSATEEFHAHRDDFLKVLAMERPPEMPLKRRCKNCDYQKRCWPELPEHSIFTLPNLYWGHTDEMLSEGLVALGEVEGHDRLKPRHARYIEALRQGEPHIDEKAIAERLAELEYPLYFFDFETVSPPVPRYEGTGPWQHVPFQYSAHVLRRDGRLEHTGYLHGDAGDPRSPLVEKMLQDLGTEGSVIVYHASFEKGRLEKLQEAFPQRAERMGGIIDRLWDQEKVFSSYAYLHPAFRGRTSIKVVLPLLIPWMSYEGMKVADGTKAQIAYERMQALPIGTERQDLFEALWDYCEQDTRAMVEIHRVLEEIAVGA